MPHVPPSPRCDRCLFPPGFCLCAAVPRLAAPFRFVILRHVSERERLSNTARWAALAIPETRVVDHGLAGQPIDEAPLREPGTYVLFPSPHPTPPPPVPPRVVVVPDGTWQQARRMLQRVPALRELPRLSLPAAPEALRLRRPPAGGMCTLEAMAGVLAHLGEPATADRLLALHAEGVERVLRLKGMWKGAA